MERKICVLLTVLAFLGGFSLQVWAQDDGDTEFDVEVGVGYHITDYNGYPGKIGEYQVLDHHSTGPDLHFSGTAQNKDLYLNFDGRYHENNDHEYHFNGDYRRILKQDFSYDRFQHWLDHDGLNNLSATSMGGGGKYGPKTSHEDFDAGKDYIIKCSEEKSDTVINLPFSKGAQLNVNYRRQIREGHRQALTISHCASCHVTSNGREVDEETEDFKIGATKKFDWLTLSYNYFHREFNERGKSPENPYDDAMHPVDNPNMPLGAPVDKSGNKYFNDRIQYDGTTRPYNVVPDSEKDSHLVKVLASLPMDTTFFASYIHSEVDNRNHNPEVATDDNLEMDSDTVSARLTNRSFPGLNLSFKFRYLTIDNDDVYVDVNEPNDSPVGPSANSFWYDPAKTLAAGQYNSFDPDFTRESAMSRDVTTLGFDARYQLLKKTSLRLGYEWEEVDRDNYAVDEEGGTETETNTVKVVLNSRPHRKVKARIGYKWQDIDDPFVAVNSVWEDVAFPSSPNPFGTSTQYWERQDARSYSRSNQPTEVNEITADLTWSIQPNLGVTANYRYTDKQNDDVGGSDWEQESHMPSINLWYAPTAKLSFNFSYIYDWTETKALACIPVYNG